MDFFAQILGACSGVQKAGAGKINEQDASPIQLNAFEFRNYRTSLESEQHRLVERVVNQWCVMLVRGKMMKVDGFEEKVYMDKDLLGLERDNEYYPLKELTRMEMFRDPEDMMEAVPFCVELTFGVKVMLGETRQAMTGSWDHRFNFEQEHQRLHFALTLRILRARDPTLDLNQPLEVMAKDDEDDRDEDFDKIVSTYHYSVDSGIPVVFSVSDLKLFTQLQSSSRHVYLEFFVRYPRQDRFLYAKSPTAHIPQKALMTEDTTMRRKKDPAAGDNDAGSGTYKQTEGVLKESMRFDLKNVKVKIPKVPHKIFGRLMAKDDYFPTAVGTFEFTIRKSHLVDRRASAGNEGNAKEAAILKPKMMSSWKVNAPGGKEEFIKIGVLTLRALGYVKDPEEKEHLGERRRHGRAQDAEDGEGGEEEGNNQGGEDEEEEDEDEEDEEDEDEDEDEEEEDG